MNKLIIDNRTYLTDAECLPYVQAVISKGRISKNKSQYCYTSTFFKYKEFILLITTQLNYKSDRFIITEQTKNNEQV